MQRRETTVRHLGRYRRLNLVDLAQRLPTVRDLKLPLRKRAHQRFPNRRVNDWNAVSRVRCRWSSISWSRRADKSDEECRYDNTNQIDAGIAGDHSKRHNELQLKKTPGTHMPGS